MIFCCCESFISGNPWPPIIARQRNTQFLLSNMLLSAARQDYYNEKKKLKAATQSSTAQRLSLQKELSSSVDPPVSSTDAELSPSLDPSTSQADPCTEDKQTKYKDT